MYLCILFYRCGGLQIVHLIESIQLSFSLPAKGFMQRSFQVSVGKKKEDWVTLICTRISCMVGLLDLVCY